MEEIVKPMQRRRCEDKKNVCNNTRLVFDPISYLWSLWNLIASLLNCGSIWAGPIDRTTAIKIGMHTSQGFSPSVHLALPFSFLFPFFFCLFVFLFSFIIDDIFRSANPL